MSLSHELKQHLGERYVLTRDADLEAYSYDGTWKKSRPDLVCLPGTTEEVATVLRLANHHGIPVTPRGAGTGLAGGSVPVRGGIVLALTRLNRILRIDEQNLLAEVEPGVITADLQRAVEQVGLYYPPDPSSRQACTIGGNIATNAGGPRCFKYGVTRDYLLGLEAVLPNGEVIRTGGRTVKNVSGYDLTRLFCGSEGTLCVITRAILRLIPQPECTTAILAVFSDLDRAVSAVPALVRAGGIPAAIEFMDQTALGAAQQFVDLRLPAGTAAALLIEVDGFREAVDRQAREVVTALQRLGADHVRRATTPQEEQDLWTVRRSINPALTRIKPIKVGEDVTVPISRMAEFVRGFHRLREQYGLQMVIFGHAGDGNLHPNVLLDPGDPSEVARMEAVIAEVARLALDLGGSLSGEHGIGSFKAPFLHWELGDSGISTIRAIKRALDPHHILNPGKLQLDPAETGGKTDG